MKMDAYTENIVTGVVRVIILFLLLFVALPKIIFRRNKIVTGENRILVSFVLLVNFIIIIVSFLSVTRLYDTVSLYLSLAVFSGIFIVAGKQGGRKDFLTHANYTGLKLFELKLSEIWQRHVAGKHGGKYDQKESFSFIWNILFLVVLIISLGLRLLPVFKQAAPFSIEAYRHLEYVKSLDSQQLLVDQLTVPKGMHAIVNAVFQLSRVNTNTLVHCWGAISALLLITIIFYVVYRITRNKPSALLSAAIFGIFNRLLPISPEQQVEANTIVLASVFIVLTLFFAVEFACKPSLLNGIVVFLSTITSIIVSYFSIVIFIYSMPVLALSVLFINNKNNHNYLRMILSTIIFIGSLVGIYFAYQYLISNPLLLAGVKTLFADESFMRFAREDMIFSRTIFFYISAGIGMLAVFLVLKLVDHPYRIHFFVWGLLTIVFALLWFSQDRSYAMDLNYPQLGFILSIIVSVVFGFVVNGLIFQTIEENIIEENVQPRSTVWSLILVLIVSEIFIIFKAPAWAQFEYQMEPDGFVRSVYEIEKKYDSYDWIVVSHFGTNIQVLNYGRYMDYLYFLTHYDPATFNQKANGVIPAKHLFIFAEKETLTSQVDTGLLPKIHDLNKKVNQWCAEFKRLNSNIREFYEDDQVRVFQIDIPQKKKLNSDNSGNQSG